MGLYEAVLEMLLERRDAERRIPDTVALDREQKVWILRDLAWLLVSTGRSELPKATALKRVAQKLESMTRVSYPPQDVLAHLLRRSGVLREPVPERIDFVHKTIQEYLAAGQIVEDEDVDLVVRNAHFDDWREVAVMTAGHATGRLRRALLAGLLERAGREAARARSLRLLVVSCLETIQEIPADLRDRIEECFRLVIPPVTETEAALLAAAGEETLRRLPDDLSGLRPEHAAMTVRTAWLINGPAALAKLAAHAADGRPNVTSELIASSAFFDTEEYARRVLSRIPRGSRSGCAASASCGRCGTWRI
ncbi:NACHT domain-containing protein [Thermocatellispora tengchongensis]|uniref:NACHT domain-containing protein n=1 Tax=Thermocatellispora tengchongensis TaxID=1073253 RepID=UPI00362FA461